MSPRYVASLPEALVFGQGSTMQAVRKTIDNVAKSNVPILIRGDSGTGKEVLAKYIHGHSRSQTGSFITVSCPAIPSALLESELFGYEQGAFTGAYESKPGLIELAAGGTLFLNEIAELDVGLQAKLLHWLQDGCFSRLGGQADQWSDARVICATNRILRDEVAAGHFRHDLLYRINVVSIDLPTLRQRSTDISGLVEYFVELYSRRYDRRPEAIRQETLQTLLQHDWPGNIRELENVIKRYVLLNSDDFIRTELSGVKAYSGDAPLPPARTPSLKQLTREAVRDLERKIILDVLCETNWNRKETARKLEISYRTLFYKLKQAGIPHKKDSPPARA